MLINIQSSTENPESIVAFTIGLKQKFNMPELIFVNEHPENAMEIISKASSNARLGIELKETIQFSNIEGEPAKMGKVPDEAKEAFTPQIKSYYEEYAKECSEYDLVWVGRKSVAYPFEDFLPFSNNIEFGEKQATIQ